MKSQPFASLASLLITLGLLTTTEGDARACGACFNYSGTYVPPAPGWDGPVFEAGSQSGTVITDHRMVLALSTDSTTLWDQVRYAGDPEGFAWILPVRGKVDVGVADEGFMDALDQLTAPVLSSPPLPCLNGGSSSSSGAGGIEFDGGASTDFDAGLSTGAGRVVVVDAAVAGPYQVVQIHATDAVAIGGWLRENQYQVPTEMEPLLADYASKGFDFLAARLRPDVGIRAMVPIRVRFAGKQPVLPLRMIRGGVASRVGISLFVIGDGRWRAKNFPTYTIDDADLYWDFATGHSNYADKRSELAAKFGGRAFALESSFEYFAGWIPPPAPSKPSKPPPTPGDAGVSDASFGDAPEASAAIISPIASASFLEGDAGGEVGGPKKQFPPPKTAPDPGPDVRTAFEGKPSRRVTRLRAELSSADLDIDLELEADDDQSIIPDQRALRAKNGGSNCPPAGTWIPNGGGGLTVGCGCGTTGMLDEHWSEMAVAVLLVGATWTRRRRARSR